MVNGKLSIAISARVAHFGWFVELNSLLTTVFDWVGRPLSSDQSHTGHQYNYKSQHFTTGFLLCVIYSRAAKRSLDTRESQVQLSDSSEHTRTLVLSKCRLISGDFKFDRVTDSKRKRSATRHCFRTTSFCGKDRFDTDTASERSRSPYLGETYTTRETTHMHTRSNTLARRDGLSGWLVRAVCLRVLAGWTAYYVRCMHTICCGHIPNGWRTEVCELAVNSCDGLINRLLKTDVQYFVCAPMSAICCDGASK